MKLSPEQAQVEAARLYNRWLRLYRRAMRARKRGQYHRLYQQADAAGWAAAHMTNLYYILSGSSFARSQQSVYDDQRAKKIRMAYQPPGRTRRSRL